MLAQIFLFNQYLNILNLQLTFSGYIPNFNADTGLHSIAAVLMGYSSMFRRSFVQKVLCLEGSMFRRFYIQKVLCSEGPMFRRSYV